MRAFMAPDDTLDRRGEFELPDESMKAAKDGNAQLVVFGYVDYIDQFNIRHRAGYARQYSQDAGQNNLVFPTVPAAAALNYDRQLRWWHRPIH